MSGTETHERLLRFLSEEMEREQHHACIKIELLYIPPGEYRRESLKSWHRQSETDKPYFEKPKAGAAVYLDRMAAEIIEQAEYHADSYGAGRHKFKVISHHAMGGGRHTHNFVIVPTGDAADGDLIGGTNDLTPTQQGLTLQLMRHLENQQRVNRDMMTSFAGAMREAMSQLREDREADRTLVRQLEKDRRDGFAEIEAARSRAHEQEIEAQIVVSESERKTFATKRIMGLLPVVVSRVLDSHDEDREDKRAGKGKAKEQKPWKPSPLSVALGELAATFDEDLEQAIAAKLTVEQQIMLGEAMRLAKKGGGPMLSQIVQDLFAGMDKATLSEILALFSSEQQHMVMRAVALAKSEAEPAAEGKKKSSGDTATAAPATNGATSTTAE